jgi:hypothetical protein
MDLMNGVVNLLIADEIQTRLEFTRKGSLLRVFAPGGGTDRKGLPVISRAQSIQLKPDLFPGFWPQAVVRKSAGQDNETLRNRVTCPGKSHQGAPLSTRLGC